MLLAGATCRSIAQAEVGLMLGDRLIRVDPVCPGIMMMRRAETPSWRAEQIARGMIFLRYREVHQRMKMMEKAARALCKFDGHAENIKFKRAPMWQSYVPLVRAVFGSVRSAAAAGTDSENWRAMIQAALVVGEGI